MIGQAKIYLFTINEAHNIYLIIRGKSSFIKNSHKMVTNERKQIK